MSAMEVSVYGLEGKPLGKISLPGFFGAPFRPDLINKAVVALQSHRLQPKGRDPMAGKRTSAESFGVGRGLARVPRVKGSRYPRAGQAAFAPSAVKGRLAFPPTPEKAIRKKINAKEYRLALKSAVAATASKELVAKRGHAVARVPEVPLVVSDDVQSVSKAKDARGLLKALGLWDDVARAVSRVKVRAGKGKMRGRAKKQPKGPLFVVAEDRGLGRALGNMPGVDVVEAWKLNVEDLAPGGHPGRLTAWTASAIKALEGRLGGS